MKYELYGSLHRTAKKLLRRSISTSSYRMINIQEKEIGCDGYIKTTGEELGTYINDMDPIPEVLRTQDLFPVENIVSQGAFPSFEDSFQKKRKCKESQLGAENDNATKLWMEFVENSEIPQGYRNGGLHYAGYILDCEEWCLPSWIWTNAALVRMYCRIGELDKARIIVDKIIELQQDCGGWIVRNDYDSEGAVPVLAPNDSAYTANNACLEFYLSTREQKYLDSTVKCAEWIIDTAREDGMVYVGYDIKRKHWQKKHNIVDVGFTAGLFARLYECTKEEKYLAFLKRFTDKFIKLFYIPSSNGFATSLDAEDKQLGGMFGRGQAWALEGLIPASRVLKDENVTAVVQSTINNLIKVQDKQGGWVYNISRPLMGLDCKATSIIACSLMDWYSDHKEQVSLKVASEKAYKWCVNHTLPEGRGKGGIYSYSTEGAIVHHLYTWTAFVYGSSYAIELKQILAEV